MPEVEFAAAATPPDFFPAFELSDGVRHVKAIGKFAEPGFLRVFGISPDGGQGNALADKNAIIITKSLARSLFGNPEAGIGKSLEWKVMGISRNVMVTGVMDDFP